VAIGTIRYPWRNVEEGETSSRLKIVKYMYFREWDWIVAVGVYEQDIYAPISPATRSAVTLFGASVLLVILFTWGMSRLIARPVIRLSKAAERLSAGDLDQAVSVSAGDGSDEVAVLARSFADMARQIRDKEEDLERQVAERTRELKDSREQYRNLVENALDCIVTADRSGTITFANSGMVTLLDIERKQIIGRKIWEFYRGGIEKAHDIMKKIREEGSIRNYEQTLLIGDRSIPILTSATMLYDVKGNEVGTMGIFTDITKLKDLEDELARTQVDLAQVHKLRALGDLVAGVAHEVNNPLMASMTMLRVIERNLGSYDDKLRKQVEVLKKCNRRITKIVYHLREFSRQTEIEKIRIDINLPLSNALLISTQQLLNMQIELELDLAADLPRILADANLLEQVFLDLFANARDAMQDMEGAKTLRVRSRAGEMNGRPTVEIEVSDTGPGISLEIQDKIFEPFFTTKPIGHGTGLGLPICHGIIENHDGWIDLETSAETGTVFTIRIPAVEDDQGPQTEEKSG
jgi:two-component system NtrC family sensor kinase